MEKRFYLHYSFSCGDANGNKRSSNRSFSHLEYKRDNKMWCVQSEE